MKSFYVSAVIPVFNRPVQIKRAVDSVLAQTYRNVECIVVDDGSTDETLSVLKEYGDRIKVISTVNRGVSAARNTGVKNATGEYIAFLDSDDEWKPEKIEKQINYMTSQKYKVSQTNETWIRNGKFANQTKKHIKTAGDIFLQSLDGCIVSLSTVVMEKTLFEKYGGFDEELAVCEDYDLWLRMSVNEKFGLIEEPLTIKYGGHSDQLSKTPALDRYRIMSLSKILNSRTDMTDLHHRELKNTLRKKLEIYLAGAKKRNNFEGTGWAEKILQSHCAS